MFSHPQLHPILCILIFNDCAHLQVVFEGTGHMVGGLAGLDAALDTGTHPLFTKNTHQRPTGLLQIKQRKYDLNNQRSLLQECWKSLLWVPFFPHIQWKLLESRERRRREPTSDQSSCFSLHHPAEKSLNFSWQYSDFLKYYHQYNYTNY